MALIILILGIVGSFLFAFFFVGKFLSKLTESCSIFISNQNIKEFMTERIGDDHCVKIQIRLPGWKNSGELTVIFKNEALALDFASLLKKGT